MCNPSKKFPRQPYENEDDNREYKLKLDNYDKIVKVASQLRYRLYQGSGKALYIIGISDDGEPQGLTLETLQNSVKYLNDTCSLLEKDENVSVKISNIRYYYGIGDDTYIATIKIVSNLFS